MKRAVAVIRKLSPSHDPVVTALVLVPPSFAPDSEQEKLFTEMQFKNVKSRFCFDFPEFRLAEWTQCIMPVNDMYWQMYDIEGQPHDADDAFNLAIEFHEAYEAMAPDFGYQTRPETRSFNPSTPNGQLMIAVCKRLLGDGTIVKKEGARDTTTTPTPSGVELRD